MEYYNNQPCKRASVGGGSGPLGPSATLRVRREERGLMPLASLGPGRRNLCLMIRSSPMPRVRQTTRAKRERKKDGGIRKFGKEFDTVLGECLDSN